MLGPQSFLTISEVHAVLDKLRPRSHQFQSKLNLAIFRLSCCCGLRTMEIVGLNLGDMNLNETRPTITVRADNTKTKNGKSAARVVPLWWDAATYQDLLDWYHFRLSNTMSRKDATNRRDLPFVCGVGIHGWGVRMYKTQIAKKWRTVMRQALGDERAKQLSIHKGRHTFASLSLAAGRSLKEVQLALGHASLKSTDVYTHLVERDVPDVFGSH